MTFLRDRQSGCDVIFSSSVWQINTKCLNLLTTFHNKRRHSFKTKEKAAPINIASIDQNVKHYKLKNPQNRVTNFYEDRTTVYRLQTGDFGDSVTSVLVDPKNIRRGGIVLAGSDTRLSVRDRDLVKGSRLVTSLNAISAN